MKNLNTLRSIINIFYNLLAIVLYISCAGFVIASFTGYITERDSCSYLQQIDFRSWKIIIFTILSLGLFYIFTRAILALKKTTSFLIQGEFFNDQVTTNFLKAGKLFIISGISLIALQFLGNLILKSEIKIGIDYSTITSTFLVIIGLFFIFFAEAFTKAQTIKQENDLTI